MYIAFTQAVAANITSCTVLPTMSSKASQIAVVKEIHAHYVEQAISGPDDEQLDSLHKACTLRDVLAEAVAKLAKEEKEDKTAKAADKRKAKKARLEKERAEQQAKEEEEKKNAKKLKKKEQGYARQIEFRKRRREQLGDATYNGLRALDRSDERKRKKARDKAAAEEAKAKLRMAELDELNALFD